MRGTRVLVTDGEQRASLAIIRSLGRSGCRVEVASVSGRSLAGASRHARADHPLPDPLTDPTTFAEGLEETVRATGTDILIPVTEPSLLAALPHRDAFDCLLPFPDLQRFRRASDKGEVARLARDVDIAVPDQVEVPGCDADVELPGNPEASYVLKPSRSVEGGRKLGVSYSPGGSRLREALAGLPDEAFPVLVQQRILGPGAGVFLLLWDGEPRAVFGHRRIREKPPSGGVSVVRESALVDSALAESATRLLRRLQWQGVAMVEFKIDGDTGTPYLMEINGRFWGSLQLAIDAGVDFPRLLVEAATGSGSHPVPSYRPGVRCRWLLGDLDQLLVRLRRSPEALNLPPGMPGRGRAIAEFLRDFLPPNRLEVLRLRDPQPFFREVRLWLQELAGGKTRNQD
jgi:predicted ATP-grasp superfamily ATP-dependent carboligase